MKARSVRWLFGTTVVLMLFGCEREIPLIDSGPIDGYQIEGYVTDRLRNPMRDVQIVLDYQFIYLDSNPPPSKSYDVTNPNQVIVVAVFNSRDQHVRTLFQGTRPVGTMLVEWDKMNAQGGEVPSGLYTVKYMENGAAKKSYYEVVSGTVSARTDSIGYYLIPSANLPVGFEPVHFTNTGGNYPGNYRIGDWIALEFIAGTQSRKVFFVLARNYSTRYDITF